MDQRLFKAKILLFGEYTIILGASALAIPVSQFKGNWSYQLDQKDPAGLNDFGVFLNNLRVQGELLSDLDTGSFLQELQKGLYFNSSIPQGYGAGSSGALCAAVYDRFARKKTIDSNEKTLSDLKNQLAQIEQYFHGSSSGIDPLVSYLDEAVLIDGQQIRISSLPVFKKGKGHLFLLNTGMARKTAPLVHLFLEKCRNEFFKNQCKEVLSTLNETAVDAFLNQHIERLEKTFAAISRFQFQHFQEMIPTAFKEVWKAGLDGDLYKLKLCGAGGGGFFIGLTKDIKQVRKKNPDYEILELIRL